MRTIENIESENGMKLWAYTCRKVGSIIYCNQTISWCYC